MVVAVEAGGFQIPSPLGINDSQGGAGFETLLGAVPLKGLGLSKGQVAYFSLSVETTSDKYDHASVDVLGGNGKMPALITWQVGSNSFQINQDFYNH